MYGSCRWKSRSGGNRLAGCKLVAQKYEVDKNRAMIADHIENGTFKNLVKQLPTPTLKNVNKERNQIASDIMLLGAVDGDVHENEAKMLMPIYITLGGTVEQFQAFGKKWARRWNKK